MTTRTTLALLLLLAVAGCSSGDGTADPDPSAHASPPVVADASPSPSELPSRAPYATGRVRTGQQPCGVLGALGRVWVSNLGDDTLVSVDPASLEVSRPIPVGDRPCGLAYGAGAVWVENFGSFDVTRVDARTGEVLATYDVGASPYDVTFTAGAAWVTNNGDGTVSRIDARTGEVTRVRLDGRPTGIAPAGGLVWVALGERGIAAIDPGTATVTHRVRTDEPALWTAYDHHRVWVTVGARVLEIDATSGEVGRTLEVGEQPADGSLLAGSVWVGDRSGLLYRFGVSGGPVESVPSTAENPFVVAGYQGRLWVADFGGTHVVRIDPRRIG